MSINLITIPPKMALKNLFWDLFNPNFIAVNPSIKLKLVIIPPVIIEMKVILEIIEKEWIRKNNKNIALTRIKLMSKKLFCLFISPILERF
jgi:hypothetical protein